MPRAKTPEGFSLRRWSRRKLEATGKISPAEPERLPVAAPVPPVVAPVPPVANASGPPAVATEPALPPVESLTAESNFAAFMQPNVDEGLRRQALKKLFADPRFNVMDGLDVYIDDYTKPDPIPPSVLERLTQMGFVRDAGASGEASIPGAPDPAAETGAAPPATTIEPTPIEAAREPASPPSAPEDGTPDASRAIDASAARRPR
jgi:hypothetical protein